MIYFVEDDDNIRKLVSYALTKEGYAVLDFARPSLFWAAIEKELPELLLLDIMLPEEDGLSILTKLRDDPKTKRLPIMMLTAKGSEYDKVTGLDLGADDYIAKPFGMVELTARVRALLRRCETDRECSGYTVDTLNVDTQKHTVTIDGAEVYLSFKEYTLLITLLSAKGAVVSRETLLNTVWGEYYEESRTLDVHIRKLRIKLGKYGSLIQTVKNVGYKMGGDVRDR